MRKERMRIVGAITILVSLRAPLAAQSLDQLEQNKKVVLDFWREVLESRHMELAKAGILFTKEGRTIRVSVFQIAESEERQDPDQARRCKRISRGPSFRPRRLHPGERHSSMQTTHHQQ
jgi:hypothetical protein